jgi:hypothetical protein
MSEGVHVLLEDLLFWVLISLSLSLAQKVYLTMGLGVLAVDRLKAAP